MYETLVRWSEEVAKIAIDLLLIGVAVISATIQVLS